MNAKKILALLLGAMMLLALAACGAKDNDKQADMSGDNSAMTGEPKTAEEALTLHKELLERENALLSENAELWEKVFMAADKGMTMQEDGKNYGDFLLDTVEAAKEQFTDKEYEWLKESATEISNIENKLTELEEKYPEIMQKSMDGDMSMPAGDDMSMPSNQSGTGKMDNQSGADKMAEQGSMQKFPAFEGKDLDGNTVKSSELFSGNAVTVVNFWFTTCNPCVGELAELDALNKELAEKGGSLIGVNTFTLDGDETAISEAKDVLAKKGATYQNVYFDSDGEAGKFTTNIFAYPTTYVVDRSGNIVGEPIVGAVTGKAQAEGCKPKSTRRSPPIWADARLKKAPAVRRCIAHGARRDGVSPDSPERRKRDVSKRIGTAFRLGAAGRLRRRAADCAEGKERTGNKHGRTGF